jgi:hypothetical protein
MNDSTSVKPERPILVRIGLCGIKSRRVALMFVWICLVAVGVAVVMQFWPGMLLLLGAWWYWCSIRWVDRNGGWK